MLELQKQFQNFINDQRLIKQGERVLLAISGGLDSMVMLDLFKKSGYSFGVAHCNFGLRGADSDEDEHLVMTTAEQLGIECFTKKVELTNQSIQLAARQQRYKWFQQLSKKKNYQKIATAHHLNDSLETTLLNLVKGTGIKGLAGIPAINGNIIRPLLGSTREELMVYAQEALVQWREDASNQKAEYDRNKLRLQVIPRLKELNPALEQTYRLTQERMELTKRLLNQQVVEVRSQHFNPQSGELSLVWAKNETDLLILNELLVEYGFNYVTVKEIFQSIGKSGKSFEAFDWKVLMDRSSLFLKEINSEFKEEVLIHEDGHFNFGSIKLEVSSFTRKPDQDLGGFISKDPTIGVLDKSKLIYPLRLRPWQVGDTFQPFGMLGRKKVSDLLIDLKVPIARKEEVWVLESAGEIMWVVGYRLSEKVKLEDHTRSILKIELKLNSR